MSKDPDPKPVTAVVPPTEAEFKSFVRRILSVPKVQPDKKTPRARNDRSPKPK